MTQRKGQVNLLSIKQFAEICHTTPRTLRFYEQKGLIKPVSINAFTKYRAYDARQAREFLKIKLIQDFDVPLSEIQRLISSKHLDRELKARVKKVKEEIIQKENEYQFLKEVSSFLSDENELSLKENTYGLYSLFCMKVTKADYNKMSEYQTTLLQKAKKIGIVHSDKLLVFYMTTNYEPKGTQIELALIYKNMDQHQIKNNDSKIFYFRRFIKTRALTYTYTGPYEYFSLIYQKLFDYVERNKISLVDMVFDIYDIKSLFQKDSNTVSATLAFPIEHLE